MTLWGIRSGKYGERENFALEKNVAVIGWDDLPDLTAVSSREALRKILEETYPDEAQNADELGKSDLAVP
ncbi:MAG: hypothetical protein EON59_02005 [Alphaproteobacteria bacterium]|nr:MAG: hypothetical protein EON59_02005 [Alphaproteobacteria bacterium]